MRLEDGTLVGDEVEAGSLVSAAGRRYPISRGIPDLTPSASLTKVEAHTRAEYDRVAEDIYDRAVDWQFKAFLEDEDSVRETMVDMLGLAPGMKMLEVGCGTGRDSFRLARRLGPAGELHMQDLSPRMVEVCRNKMRGYAQQMKLECALEYSASSATALPYEDATFDALFHFGGFNHFGDLKKSAAELARVVKKGGRILIGDEAVAPWLKGSEFDAVVSTNNALFKADIPLYALPDSARDVTARWLIANCFYVIAFAKGDGPPPLDLDLKHAGSRGGSLRTRYFGVLEGVSLEAKALVREAAAKAGVSMHDWLDAEIKGAARRELSR
ncbi:MAG: methyltransferase domain-containing protein [Xanthobacteraceae bacterium]